MPRTLRPYALTALAVVVISVAENVFFGRDTPGTAHDVSIIFFFLFLAGLVVLLATGGVAVARKLRPARSGGAR